MADTPANDDPAVPNAGQNVDQIRDILFGGQMRDYEKRFARVEEETARELTRLREDVDKRLKSLQQLVTGEIESLSERLAADSREYRNALASHAKESEKSFGQVDDRITELEANYDRKLREIRKQNHDDNEAAEQALRRVQDELVALIRREADSLGAAKVERTDLAAMLTEVAMRLNNEFELPSGEG